MDWLGYDEKHTCLLSFGKEIGSVFTEKKRNAQV